MKRLSCFFFVIIGIVNCTESVLASIGDSIVTKARNYIGLELGQYSSSSFYDNNNNTNPKVIDTFDFRHEFEYSYNMKTYNLNLELSQAIIEKPNFCLFADLSLPLSINNIESKFLANVDSAEVNDSLTDVAVVYDKTNFPYLKLGLGADYKISDFIFGAGANAFISFLGSEQSKVEGAEYFDLYYSNITPYLSVMYKGEKSFFELSGAYQRYLDSPISDMLKLKFGIGLTTVESSAFGAYLEYNFSTKNIDKSIPFSPYNYQLQENYLKLGINFQIIVEDFFIPGISYDLHVTGNNTKNMGIFRIYAKFLLNLNK